MNDQKNERKTGKMPTWQKVTIIVILSLLALGLISGITFWTIFDHYYDMTNYVPLDSTDEIIYDISTDPEETWDPDLVPDDDTEPPVTQDTTTSPVTVDSQTTTPNTGNGTSTPVTTPNITPTTSVVTTPTTTVVTAPVTTRPSYLVTPPQTIPGDNVEYKQDVILANALNDYRMEFDSYIKNILLIGDDGFDGTTTARRSDSMMIVSINERTGKIVVTSLPRDMYVYIPGLKDSASFNRLNAAYAHGGVSMLINTIEVNFKIKIDKYVKMNFSSFIKVIDILGGVEVNMTQTEIDYMAERGYPLPEGTKPGLVKMNGEQTLNYCRCRHVKKFDPVANKNLSGDFARTYRQREVLTILFNKMKKTSISDINDMLEEILPKVTHNFTKSEVLSYISDVAKYLKYEIVTQQLLAAGGWSYATIDGRSVYKMDFQRCWTYLEKKIKE